MQHQCWKYHSHHHSNAGGNNWAPIEDMMNSRSNAAAVTINDGVSFLISVANLFFINSEANFDLLFREEIWHFG